MIEQFVDNFNLNVFKEKKVAKSKKMENDELLTNDVVLIILNDESELEDGLAYSEKDEYEMAIMIDCNIQKFKKTNNVLNV